MQRIKFLALDFFKNKIISIAVLVIYIILTLGTVFFVKLGFTGFMLLYVITRYNFYICVFLFIISFYFFSTATFSQCESVFNSCMNKKEVWRNSAAIILGGICIIYNITLIIILLIASLKNDGSHFFIGYFWKDYAYNVFIPQVICIGMSYVFSTVVKYSSILASMMSLIFIIMISPMVELLVWMQKPKGIPYDYIVNMVRLPFEILYQNSVWSPDAQSGLQTEHQRLLIQFIWIILIMIVAVIHTIKHYKKNIITFILAIGFVFTLISIYKPCSTYRLKESWNGIYEDYNYYLKYSSTQDSETKVSDLKVSEYSLNIDINNLLKVNGTFEVENNEANDTFSFTLYHGYNINELKINGENVDYIRQEDLIICNLKKEYSELDVYIEYEGYSNKYYSNSEGVMLPGYFAWYPMPGEKNVYTWYHNDYAGGYGYNVYNRVELCKFNLNINCDSRIICNLDTVETEDKDNQTFSGMSNGITLIGGKVENVENSVIKNILPLLVTKGEDVVTEYEQQYNRMIYNLQTVWGIDCNELKEKKIIFSSEELSRNNSNNYISVYSDHILLPQSHISSAEYINYKIIENNKKTELANLLYYTGMLLDDESLTPKIVVDNLISDSNNKALAIEEINGTPDEALKDLPFELKQANEFIGPDNLIKELVQYLITDNGINSDYDFFEYLKTKYNYV